MLHTHGLLLSRELLQHGHLRCDPNRTNIRSMRNARPLNLSEEIFARKLARTTLSATSGLVQMTPGVSCGLPSLGLNLRSCVSQPHISLSFVLTSAYKSRVRALYICNGTGMVAGAFAPLVTTLGNPSRRQEPAWRPRDRASKCQAYSHGRCS